MKPDRLQPRAGITQLPPPPPPAPRAGAAEGGVIGKSDAPTDSPESNQGLVEPGPLVSGITGSEQRKRRRPEPSPVQRALGLLTRREHSRKELTRKLTDRGVERVEAAAAIEKLCDAGWQDDARFAQFLVRSRAATGYGPIRIRAELGLHGLDREAVAAALDSFDGDWAANAQDLVRRRFGQEIATDRNRQRKAADMLVRRGFAAGHIRTALRCDPED
jgi:regulatory protein